MGKIYSCVREDMKDCWSLVKDGPNRTKIWLNIYMKFKNIAGNRFNNSFQVTFIFYF